MGGINRNKTFPQCLKAILLELGLHTHHKWVLGQPRLRWRGVPLVFQDTLGTILLEPEDPKAEWDPVVIIKLELNILNDPAVAIYVMYGNVMIMICPLAGLLHAFQLNNGRQLGKLMNPKWLTIALDLIPVCTISITMFLVLTDNLVNRRLSLPSMWLCTSLLRNDVWTLTIRLWLTLVSSN